MSLGARFGFCAVAPADAPAASNDTTERFVGARNSPAPPACPPMP